MSSVSMPHQLQMFYKTPAKRSSSITRSQVGFNIFSNMKTGLGKSLNITINALSKVSKHTQLSVISDKWLASLYMIILQNFI